VIGAERRFGSLHRFFPQGEWRVANGE